MKVNLSASTWKILGLVIALVALLFVVYFLFNKVNKNEPSTTTTTTTLSEADKKVNTEGDASKKVDDKAQTQGNLAKYPFYGSLPYDSDEYFIDLPTTEDIIPVYIKNKANEAAIKEKVLEWFKTKGMLEVSTLKIEWRFPS